MPFQPVPQTVQMDIQYLWNDQEVQNSLYFRVPSDTPAGDMTPFAIDVVNAFGTRLSAVVPTTLALTNLHFTDLSAQDSWGYDFPVRPQVPGTNSSQGLPNNCSLAINLGTNVRGKNGRGRIFAVGLIEGAVNNNTVLPSWVESWLLFLDDVRSAALEAGYEMVVVSRYIDKQKRETGVTYSVTSISVKDYTVDSQRRRLPGRGR